MPNQKLENEKLIKRIIEPYKSPPMVGFPSGEEFVMVSANRLQGILEEKDAAWLDRINRLEDLLAWKIETELMKTDGFNDGWQAKSKKAAKQVIKQFLQTEELTNYLT